MDSLTPADRQEALVAALLEIEHHVGVNGWDQPARLFALVPTLELISQEPTLAEQLQLSETTVQPGALSSIEQEDFREVGQGGLESDLPEVLARISWSPSVGGCALVVERAFLPAQLEAELPDDPEEAAEFVAHHPQRQELRLVVGVMRDGTQHAVARLKSQPDELLGGGQMAPGVSAALAATLG